MPFDVIGHYNLLLRLLACDWLDDSSLWNVASHPFDLIVLYNSLLRPLAGDWLDDSSVRNVAPPLAGFVVLRSPVAGQPVEFIRHVRSPRHPSHLVWRIPGSDQFPRLLRGVCGEHLLPRVCK